MVYDGVWCRKKEKNRTDPKHCIPKYDIVHIKMSCGTNINSGTEVFVTEQNQVTLRIYSNYQGTS